ncbi:MAG TPA: hypothetical protein VKY59_08175, partial [Spirillospora sp.]|nr:hypothetical protein [Spirillospora sp.]
HRYNATRKANTPEDAAMFDNSSSFPPFDDVNWNEPDFLLSYLVSSLVNLGRAPVGITLLIKGMVLSGTLMSEREYLNTLSSLMQRQVRDALNTLPKQDREIAEKAFDFRDLTEDFYPDDGDEDEDEESGPEPLSFLHLRNPVIVSPQPVVSFSSGLFPVMRIRLSNIDGWMLGASMPEDLDDFMGGNGNNDIKH